MRSSLASASILLCGLCWLRPVSRGQRPRPPTGPRPRRPSSPIWCRTSRTTPISGRAPSPAKAGSLLYPIDTGLTIGVSPWDKLQLEVGYDLLLPSEDPVVFLLNAKLGTPENTFFKGSPSLAAGIFGVGIKKSTDAAPGTDFDVVYGQVQKNLPWGG